MRLPTPSTSHRLCTAVFLPLLTISALSAQSIQLQSPKERILLAELPRIDDLPDAPSAAFLQAAQTVPLQQRPQPGAEPSTSAPPSLDDLGLAPAQQRADPDLQKKLDRRTEMLKIHQRLGIITLAPLAAACLSSALAPPDPRNGNGNTVGRDIHLSLGSLAVMSYGATAYYAIRAPKIDDGHARGGIKWHKYLIYVHAPGMVLTPILGAMAFQQANNGEKVHGIASAHAAVAWTTVASYSAAILAVSWPLTHKN
ncbi:hypothetical protein [Terriglobus roseus]|uniref:Cytochrome b561 domain-containing protein n=1 Tax=Terriglobus roseus TaxID=392734 RepID=A0A1H4JI01_9BACT|nr:hypothetical protein [Terriglobus roseus]SEB45238.1 hypothetical protein SAMN05443244_0595 [Terriglobus roseus]